MKNCGVLQRYRNRHWRKVRARKQIGNAVNAFFASAQKDTDQNHVSRYHQTVELLDLTDIKKSKKRSQCDDITIPVAGIGELVLKLFWNKSAGLKGFLFGGSPLINTIVIDRSIYDWIVTAVGSGEQHNTVCKIIQGCLCASGNKLPVIALLCKQVSAFSCMERSLFISRKRIDCTDKSESKKNGEQENSNGKTGLF